MRRLAKAFLLVFLLGLSIEVAVRISGHAGPFVTDPAFHARPGASYWQYRADRQFTVYGPTDLRTGPLGERRHGPRGPKTGPLVAVFGDSFTFGQAVADHETWPAQLEAALRPRFPGVRVMNFGVQGHSLRMIVAHAQERLQTIRPALVVLAFIGDDLDPGREQKHVDRFGYLARGGPDQPIDRTSELLRAIARQSHGLLWFKHWLMRVVPSSENPEPSALIATVETREQPVAVLPANLPVLIESLADTPLILAELDLAETKKSRWLRRELERRLPEVSLVYMPPNFSSAPDSVWRVPGDGHPSGPAHAIYASTLVPAVSQALEKPAAADALIGTAPGKTP